VGQMELASDVRLALLHREDYFGAVLAMIEAYEQGAWEEVEAWAAVVGVTSATLGVLYLKAIEWASDQTRQSERRHTA
jgi:c-di-GMP-related signal transduction protein